MEQQQAMITYIVDDDRFYQLGIKRLLDFIPIEKNVLQFYDGKQAMDYIKQTAQNNFPNVIFLDINMPVMNGWDFLNEYSKLDNKPEKPPVIYMVTSSMHDADIAKASSYKEINEYVIKPITLTQLQTLLDKAHSN